MKSPSRIHQNQRGMPLVLIAALLLYAAIIGTSFQTFLVAGDETDYLTLAESLLVDGDVDLRNQYADVQFKHGFDYQADGRIRSVHGIGLPLIILPAYAVAGRLGASAVVVLLGALLAALTFSVCRTVTASAGAAAFATAAVAASLPVVIFATQVYTEVPAALLTLAAVGLLVDRLPTARAVASPRLMRCIAAGLVLGALPWLHAKYVVPAGIVGLFFLVALWRRGAWRQSLALGATAGALYGLLLLLFYRWYGNVWPDAPYRPLTGAWSTLEGIPTGAAGLLLDRMAGLLPNAPVYLLAVPGLLVLGFRAHLLAALVAGLFGVSLVLNASHVAWWGAGPAPARYLTPVVPLLALPMAALWAWPPGRWAIAVRGASGVLLGISLLAGGLVLADRRLALSADDGRPRLQEWLWGPAVSTAGLLPGLVSSSTRTSGQFHAHVGRIVPDRLVYGNQARLAEAGRDPAGFLAFSEPISLRSGKYRAFFRLKVDRQLPMPVARIDLARHRSGTIQSVAEQTLTGLDFTAPGAWQDFTLVAEVFEGDRLEPRVYYEANGAHLWFDRVFIARRISVPLLDMW